MTSLSQGAQSFVELNDKRLTKHIDEEDVWGEFIEPWREFKILEYISRLSPYFPQNVIEKGPYSVEYDYVPGKQISDFTQEYFEQICELYYILNINGFAHGDCNPENFIIDSNNKVHIIDFGLTFTTKYRGPLIFGIIDGKNFVPPTISYVEETYPISNEFYEEICNLLGCFYGNSDNNEWITAKMEQPKENAPLSSYFGETTSSTIEFNEKSVVNLDEDNE